jgi:hypothetical protein
MLLKSFEFTSQDCKLSLRHFRDSVATEVELRQCRRARLAEIAGSLSLMSHKPIKKARRTRPETVFLALFFPDVAISRDAAHWRKLNETWFLTSSPAESNSVRYSTLLGSSCHRNS